MEINISYLSDKMNLVAMLFLHNVYFFSGIKSTFEMEPINGMTQKQHNDHSMPN